MRAVFFSRIRLPMVAALLMVVLTGPSRYQYVGPRGIVETYGPCELIKRFSHPTPKPCSERRTHLHRTSCRVVPIDQAWTRREAFTVPAAPAVALETPRAAAGGRTPILSKEQHPVVPFHLDSKR
jgi:hypothetical protein